MSQCCTINKGDSTVYVTLALHIEVEIESFPVVACIPQHITKPLPPSVFYFSLYIYTIPPHTFINNPNSSDSTNKCKNSKYKIHSCVQDSISGNEIVKKNSSCLFVPTPDHNVSLEQLGYNRKGRGRNAGNLARKQFFFLSFIFFSFFFTMRHVARVMISKSKDGGCFFFFFVLHTNITLGWINTRTFYFK